MTDRDYTIGRTPNGDRIHFVSTTESMLAHGTRNATDHESVCGEVPREWKMDVTVSDPDDLCKKCARTALTNSLDVPTTIGTLGKAVMKDGGDDGEA